MRILESYAVHIGVTYGSCHVGFGGQGSGSEFSSK